MISEIKKATSNGYGNAILYTAILAAAVTDVIPTVADALFFYDSDRLKKKLNEKQITPNQYWTKTALGYYLYNPFWWLAFGGLMIVVGGDYKHKLKIGVAVLGGGAVVTVLYKNIKKDNSQSK